MSIPVNITIEIFKCDECPYLGIIQEGNPLVDEKVSYHCAKLNSEILFPHKVDARCPFRFIGKPDKQRWFDAGRKAALRSKNSSGCACVFDEDDTLIEVCKAHADWLNECLDGSISSRINAIKKVMHND